MSATATPYATSTREEALALVTAIEESIALLEPVAATRGTAVAAGAARLIWIMRDARQTELNAWNSRHPGERIR